MPEVVLLVIGIIFLVSAPVGAILAFRWYLKKNKNEYEARIKSLEHNLAAANSLLAKQISSLQSVQGANVYEKYAGLVVSHMDFGVLYIDKDGIVRLINAYAERYLDLAAAVGTPYQKILHIRKTGSTADDYTLFESALTGKAQSLPENYQILSQHGTFPINGTIIPIETPGGVAAILFVFSDNSTQETRIKEEQAFFSTAVHEIRTPLTVIRMTAALLQDKFETLPKEKIVEHLKRTNETAERLAKLVNDFLNISRIDQGRLQMNPETFDIMALTDEVIHDVSPLATERKLYIHHEPGGSQGKMVLGDRTRAKEVLTNLISNGLKYTIQGGLTISHRMIDSTIATDVADTGTGIPAEYQRLLFKRFQQIGEAREQESAKSTGLGLYISKKFAQLMHGDVTLTKSEPGTGSTFTFSLPVAQ